MPAKSNSSCLKPEHEKVVNLIDERLLDLKTTPDSPITEDVKRTNYLQLFTKKITCKDIPSGCQWRWNQTKSRKAAFLEHNQVQISMSKLIPRKRTNVLGSYRLPCLKLWLITVHGEKNYSILWCEKGIDSNEPFADFGETESPSEEARAQRVKNHVTSESLPDLQELRFLGTFMPPSLSKEFWPI